MPTVLPPTKNDISGTAPNPSNAVARAAFGKLHDWAINLFGSTGTPEGARAALGLPSNTALNYALNTDYLVNQRNVAGNLVGAGAGHFYRDCWYGGAAGYNISNASPAGDLNQRVYLPQDGNSRSYTISWAGVATVKKDGVTITSPHTFMSSGGATPVIITQAFAAGSAGLITNLLFEPGQTQTQWSKPEPVAELLRCQRFCFPFDENLGNIITASNVGSPNIRFPVEMASTPIFEGAATLTASSGLSGTPLIYTGAGVPASKKSVFITNSAANWSVGNQVRLTAVFMAV